MDTSFISLHNEDLGDWSELSVLSVLSLLQQEFYSARLVQSLANAAMSSDKPFHVYANQTQGQVEQCNPTSLLVENSVSGVEVKADHEGACSAAPVVDKWSHEAIVARSNMRPGRMQKLKVAANSGQNPGFEYLQESWDDPVLQIVIKKLLVKFPQWGIAIVDGVLVH